MLLLLGVTGLAGAEAMRFYVGTYTTKLGHVDGKASAIGVYELDAESGVVRLVGQSPAVVNSSHLCLSADGRHLFVSSEVVEHEGRDDGYLTTFGVDTKNGSLTEQAKVSSHGPGPAYVHLDRSGRYLLLANYVAGNVVVYPISDNGELGEPTANVAHTGSGPNQARQEAPHPHAIVPSPDNHFVYVPDLGIDRIVAYRFDEATGALTASPDRDAVTPPGSGPRHFICVKSPAGGTAAYCTLELSSELAAYRLEEGKLVETARVSTLPEGFAGESTNAEVRATRDGRHVYVSNRGHDSIAVFEIGNDAKPTLIQTISSAGRTPRNFGLSLDERWAVVGNQDSHSLVVLRRDPATGKLEQSSEPMHSPSPALIYFVGN